MKTELRSQRRKSRAGAAAVELAVLLPFLMFLLVISVDYARMFYFGVTLQNCARNGSYFASNYPNNSHIYTDLYGYTSLDDAIRRDASDLSPQPTYTVRYGTAAAGPFNLTEKPAGDCHVQVTVYWTFNSITRFPGLPSQVNVGRTAVMRVAPAMPSFD